MATYIGNLNHIVDFERLLTNLRPGAIDQLFIHSGESEDDNSFRMNQPLRDAGYSDPAWDGITYSPVTHFDKEVILQLNQALGSFCTACWISELKPGQVAPPHRDIDRRDPEFQTYGELVKFSINLGKPEQGHAFFVDNECIYDRSAGDAFRWTDPNSLHCGSNCGLTPKFLIVYSGIILNKNVTAEYIWDEEKLKTVAPHRQKFLDIKFTVKD